MTSESDFIAAADATLDAIAAALDVAQAASDADFDWSHQDGILQIEGNDGGKLIVNRHVPNREIWVAARSGGFHFAARDGRWRDTRNGEELGAALARLIEAHTGVAVDFGELRAP
jgi:CyaY protein